MGDSLKPGWRRVRLGDVAVERTDRVENPADSEFDRYVGSDDMDRFDWSVRRWRPASDVTSAAKVFHPGDYLFVRRSLYASDFRERAARADFSGVCSGDILPLRERFGAMEPGFLGAVLNHPRIWEYVVQHATGSITRRIKWRDLAAYEFDLPPVNIQAETIEVLGRSDEVVCAHREAVKLGQELYQSALSHLFIRADRGSSLSPTSWAPAGWPCLRLQEVGDPEAPISYGIVQVGESTPGGVPTATSNNLNIGFESGIHLTAPAVEASYARSRVRGGDVLVTVKGFGTGNIAVVPDFFSGNINRDVARLRFRSDSDAEFFIHLWRCSAFERYWRGVSVGTTRPELSIGKLRDMLVPWPAEDVRADAARRLSTISNAVATARSRKNRALALHRRLNEEALCPRDERGVA